MSEATDIEATTMSPRDDEAGLAERVETPPPVPGARSAADAARAESVSASGSEPVPSVDPAAGFFRLRGVRKRYGVADGEGPAAIDIEALDIPLGGIIAIVGGSGSGKSTLLNLLGGLEAPDENLRSAPRLDLRLPGSPTLHQLGGRAAVSSPRAVDRYPRRHASYVFQQGYLLSQASIGLNLEITRRAAGHRADPAALRALMTTARLDLATGDAPERGGSPSSGPTKRLVDRAVTLSGGQQQRLNIARALGREPTLLFADEPTSSLDPQTAVDVLATLSRWVRAGAVTDDRTRLTRTMIWVTHDYHLACRFADALLVLAPGRPMPGLGAPLELAELDEPVTPERIESWLREGRLPPRLLCAQRPLDDIDAKARVIVSPETAPALATAPVSSTDAYRTESADAWATHPFEGARGTAANMLAGIRLSWMEAFREPSARHGSLRELLALPLRFTHLVRALQFAAVLALILIVTHGRQAVVDYFDTALADPALRHVIVQQNVRELERSVIDTESLAALDASIAEPRDAARESLETPDDLVAGIDAEPPPRLGFGRFTEALDIYPEGVDSIAPGYIAEAFVGILEQAEPVYAGLVVTPLGDGLPGCVSNERAVPGDLIDYADELVLIVSRRYVRDFRRMYGIDLCASPRVDLWDAGDPLTFRVAGVAERLPADGYERFDAIMQADIWRTWVSRVGKAPLSSYSRAAVYFDRGNHARVLDALRERAFAFDDEIVSKFERLIATAARLRNTFMAITWLSLGVAITVAAGLIWSYLTQNAKAIALLRAHDAWRAPLLAAIPFQLTLTFAASLLVLGAAVFLWNALLAFEPLRAALGGLVAGAVDIAPVPDGALLDSAPTLLLTYLAVIAVGLASLGAWRVLHPSLAHELRETE